MNRVLVCLPEDRKSVVGDRTERETPFENEEDGCHGARKKLKVKSDTSHRDIEKRRRDRINRSLWLLKDLIPSAKGKYGTRTGRLEKAELLEMAVDHLKQLNESGLRTKSITPMPSEAESQAAAEKPNIIAADSLYTKGFRDGALKILYALVQKQIISDSEMATLSSSLLEQASAVSPLAGKLRKETEHYALDEDASCVTRPAYSDAGSRHPDSRLDNPPRKRAHLADNSHLSDSDGADSEDNSSNSSSSGLVTDKTATRIKHADSSRVSPVEAFQKCSDESHDDKTAHCAQNPAPMEDGPFNQFTPSPHLNPVLLPAYALHASGTHYVPVILPPWGAIPPHSNTLRHPHAAAAPQGQGVPPEFKLSGPNPFFGPGAFSGSPTMY